MTKFLNMTEAMSLALHTAVVLASHPNKRMSAKEIAAGLHASEFHLAKVLQRLVNAGLLLSRRGPSGGFSLSPKGLNAVLLDFLRAVSTLPEGHMCLFEQPVCSGDCILGDLLDQVDKLVLERLAGSKISDFAPDKMDPGQVMALGVSEERG